MKQNEIIRATAARYGVKHWQIAERLGISEGLFSRRLRHEFDEQEREKVLSAIKRIAAERKGA